MTKEELAKLLDGGEYGSFPSFDQCKLAKENGLLIVYGGSDDLCEFAGAFNDEADCYDGGSVFIDEKGVIPEWESVESPDAARSWLARDERKSEILAVWCGPEGYSWTYKTDLPHSTFDIMEDDEKYCRGMVIDVRDLEGFLKGDADG